MITITAPSAAGRVELFGTNTADSGMEEEIASIADSEILKAFLERIAARLYHSYDSFASRMA